MWETVGVCIRKGLLFAIMVVAVTGCVSNKHKPLPYFETMSIQTQMRPANGVRAQADKDSANQTAKVGAAGGAAAGALSGLACGPFALFCVPAGMVVGAVSGGVAGAAVGQVGDAMDLLPKEQAEQVDTILADIESRRDFFVEIRDGLSAKVPQSRQVANTDAEAVIYVGLEKIELVQHESSHLSLRLTATIYAEWNRDKETPRSVKRRYMRTTTEMPIEDWLSDKGAAFDAGFSSCIEQIVQMMIWDLAPLS